jgi:riboflavin kinase/FMN adenylyltransferase
MSEGFKERNSLMKGVWITIGSFDGIHLGHQKIIKNLVQGAKRTRGSSIVITFFPHPAVYLRDIKDPYYLSLPEEKDQILSDLGVDSILTVHFDHSISRLSPEDFICMLHRQLKFTYLIVGHDFRLGADREGDLKILKNLSKEMGFCVRAISPLQHGTTPVSSSTIRAALKKGDVSSANKILGYLYSITGTVVHGDGRGKHIGIPTANLSVWEKKLIPTEGVYAAYAVINKKRIPAVVSIGFRPTFYENSEERTIEAHILDFSDQIYGIQIKLQFIARLREEKKYSSVKELMEQIHKDINETKKALSNETAPTNISS